jgi:hypothetical protein
MNNAQTKKRLCKLNSKIAFRNIKKEKLIAVLFVPNIFSNFKKIGRINIH